MSSCGASIAAVAAWQDAGPIRQQLLHCLGLKVQGLLPALTLPIGLTALLFLGPLAMGGIDWGFPDDNGQAADFPRPRPQRRSWAMDVRDLMAAPLTEEFVFRACMVPLLLHRGSAVTTVVAVSPLFFGIAHLHHLYDLVTFQEMAFSRAMQQVVGQMLYTTIFGAYATWLLIRTGNLGAPIIVHLFCNVLGFPDFDAMAAHQHQPLLSALSLTGVLLFAILFKPATMPALFSGPLAVPNTLIDT